MLWCHTTAVMSVLYFAPLLPINLHNTLHFNKSTMVLLIFCYRVKKSLQTYSLLLLVILIEVTVWPP